MVRHTSPRRLCRQEDRARSFLQKKRAEMAQGSLPRQASPRISRSLLWPYPPCIGVNQRLDEVRREFIKSKEEVGESSKGRSSFVLEIQDEPVLLGFRLPALEHYDGSSDPSEHIAAFRAQMALYDTSDSLMC
ncbi:hypothetical protein B296_00002602 [Ensete ventricosum]|uniref:Uncharacterized protein n=1 Tax=Ensete ventricosum TaxID=4639 RepID=A0A426ZR43_ENSVE|nr:hypothetical protein B296_00002602 [Ensete ventricosum]